MDDQGILALVCLVLFLLGFVNGLSISIARDLSKNRP